jgi:hypothetical protein
VRTRTLAALLVTVSSVFVALPAPADAAPTKTALARTDHTCDPIDPTACLLPFPNNWFTVADTSTATGRRVDLAASAMPHNILGKGIDPAAWNLNDGYSPGSMLLAHVPGLDLGKSGAAPVTNVGSSLRPDAPIVIVDTATGQRWPYWAELDANATKPKRQALIVRPARNFLEGHHYAVALRGLRDGSGRTIAPTGAFTKLLGSTLSKSDPLYERQRAERPVLKDLARRGVGTKGLYLAWDFTVASRRNLSERMLHIRDEAFKGLGAKAPNYVITKVTDNAPGEAIAREVQGIVFVPSYLDQYGGPPGSSFHYGKDGLPARLPGNVQGATFQCEIPRAAFTRPAQASLYGHGLLGDESEVGAGSVKAMGPSTTSSSVPPSGPGCPATT